MIIFRTGKFSGWVRVEQWRLLRDWVWVFDKFRISVLRFAKNWSFFNFLESGWDNFLNEHTPLVLREEIKQFWLCFRKYSVFQVMIIISVCLFVFVYSHIFTRIHEYKPIINSTYAKSSQFSLCCKKTILCVNFLSELYTNYTFFRLRAYLMSSVNVWYLRNWLRGQTSR